MAGPDLSLVMAAVDFSTVVEAVLYVAIAVVYVYVAWKGSKMLLAAVRGASSCDGGSDGFGADDWLSDEEYQRIRRQQARIDIRSKMGEYF